MLALVRAFAETTAAAGDGSTNFNWSSLGLSGVFLCMLVFVVREYLKLQKRTDVRELEYRNLVERLAVVLDRVQNGMAQQVQRVERSGPSPEEMSEALKKLERMQERLANKLDANFRRTDRYGERDD